MKLAMLTEMHKINQIQSVGIVFNNFVLKVYYKIIFKHLKNTHKAQVCYTVMAYLQISQLFLNLCKSFDSYHTSGR